MLWLSVWQLKSSRWQVRAEAAARLGASRQKRAAPALIRALENENAAVRLAVIEALGAICHPAAAEALAASLAGLSRRPKDALAAEEAPSREAEYEALALALGALGPAAVPPLLRLLDSDERDARRWATHALGRTRDPRAADPLIKRLGDNRSDVRKAAALALGEIGDRSALESLVKTLANRDPETRRAAAVALGMIGSDQAADPLCALLEDPNEPVQLAVVEALRRIGGLRGGAGLRAALDGGRKNVRESPAAALSSLQFAPASAEERAAVAVLAGDFPAALREGAAAAGALLAALGSRNAQRRRQAAEALAALRPAAAVDPLLRALRDLDVAVREAAARALAEIGPAALDGLVGMLAHNDATAQRLAARSLGDIGDPRAVAALADAIEQNRFIASDYPEPLEVVRAAAAAVAAIFARCSSSVPKADLLRIAAVPDAVRQDAAGRAGEIAFDCSPIRDLAQQELNRR